MAAAALAPGPARRARQTLYGAIEAESADLAERQSLRWMWNAPGRPDVDPSARLGGGRTWTRRPAGGRPDIDPSARLRSGRAAVLWRPGLACGKIVFLCVTPGWNPGPGAR